jgi:Skp family chaperone for outer membrane proteins
VNYSAQSSFRFLLPALAGVALFAASPALAQTTTTQPTAALQAVTVPGGGPIGVLNVEEVMLSSSAGKSITAQADARVKALQNDSQKKEDALVAQLKQLDAQHTTNPALPDYEAKRQAILAQDDKLHVDYQKNREAVDQIADKARQILFAAGKKAMQEVAKAKGMNLVLNRNAVNLFPDPLDITDEVIQRVNKTLPNVKLQ